jgi:hypothetical protein
MLGNDGMMFFGFIVLPIIGLLLPILIPTLILGGVAISVLLIISWWRIFKKAGRPGWAAIIPIYNLVVIFRIIGLSPWLICLLLLVLVPHISIIIITIAIFYVVICIKLAKAFGKGVGFILGLILLPIIFISILGLGQSKFVGATPAPTKPEPVPLQAPNVPPVSPVDVV